MRGAGCQSMKGRGQKKLRLARCSIHARHDPGAQRGGGFGDEGIGWRVQPTGRGIRLTVSGKNMGGSTPGQLTGSLAG